MTSARRRLFAWILLLLAALLGGAWLLHLDYDRKITTDVLDLIPSGADSPELALVRSLASEAEARTMLFALTQPDGTPAPAAAAGDFAAALAQEPAFTAALAMNDSGSRDALGRELFDQRLALLFPRWLHEREDEFAATGRPASEFSTWLPHRTAQRLTEFLARPEAIAFQDIIPADPLLLLAGAVDRLQGGLALVQPAAPPGAHPPTLVWAQLTASPLTEAGQAPAFAAIDRTTARLQSAYPGLRAAYSGVNRFAAASRATIEREVRLLNLLSLAAVLAVAFTFIRSVHRGLHLLPVVACSLLGAWVCVTLAFDRVHILVFVVGSLLTGVAIDYGFYLYLQPPAYPNEDYASKVRRLLKPLLASCFTTVAGFALLLASELPFIRQLGVFVGAGLICALLAAIVYFATLRQPFLDTRAFQGGRALPPRLRTGLRRALLAAWVIALAGLLRLSWRDDIRDLEIPSEEIKREDARIRALFGDDQERTVYLTYGDNLAAARAAVEKLEAWLQAAGQGRTRTISLAAILPTPEETARARTFVTQDPAFPAALRTALGQAGFEEESFSPFFADWPRAMNGPSGPPSLDAAVASLQPRLTGPLGLLLHTGQPMTWLVTLASAAPVSPPPPETSTVSTGQLQSLNQLFSRYRASALRLSLIGLAIVGLGVFLTYGLRDGVRIFAIPCGACLGVFGLFGWIGQPLNLFHLLGAFLGVCLTHNYSIFSATSAYQREAPPVSVRISALTTAASFGVLALSDIPVVRALGLTVALMVVAALLVIELEHLGHLGRRA